jgi:amino-acid N-acetyltransferase
MLCMLDGSVFDDNGRLLRWMTLQEADALVRERAETSGAAADYVDLMAGPPCITLLSGPGYGRTLHLDENQYSLGGGDGRIGNGSNGFGVNGTSVNGASVNGTSVNGSSGNDSGDELCDVNGGLPGRIVTDVNGNVYKTTPWKRGFPVKGGDRLEGGDGYLAELAAAVYACKGGVRRVHLIDATVGGSLLLELYTRDGIGTMISSDLYEGTRSATSRDLTWIQGLLKPLEDDGILVQRSEPQMVQELPFFTVVERDGAVIACAALFPFAEDRSGEVAAFAVAPECRGHGRGDNLLGELAPLLRERENGVVRLVVCLCSLFLVFFFPPQWFC